MKTGAQLEIERKRNEESKKIDGKYDNPYSYNQQNSKAVSTTTLEEDVEDLKGMFDFRSEEQKRKAEEIKTQKEQEEYELNRKIYFGNIVKVNGIPLPSEYREMQENGTVKNFIDDMGLVKESVINKNFNYKINSSNVTITQFRSMIFPNKLDHISKSVTLEVTPKDINGKSVSDNAYFRVHYSQDGSLKKIIPSHKIHIPKSDQEPVLMLFGNQICTLPITSKHYKYLDSVASAKNETVEYIDDVVELGGDSSCIIC